MAKTKFIDSIGREAYKDERGMVYTEGGTRPTNYDVNTWNTRQKNKSNPTSGQTSATSPGRFDLNKAYESAFKSKDITELEKKIEERQKAQTRASGDINDNPFYAEATRTGKLAKMEDQSQRDITTLQSQLALKQADAQVKLGVATQQYQFDRQDYQDKLAQFNTLVDTGAIANLSPTDIAGLSTTLGMSPSMIQALKTTKTKSGASRNPQAFTATDDQGNVTISIIDLNSGALIGSQKLSGAGKGSSSATNFNVDQYFQGKMGGSTQGGAQQKSNISQLWG
jgi:hypothetical protein